MSKDHSSEGDTREVSDNAESTVHAEDTSQDQDTSQAASPPQEQAVMSPTTATSPKTHHLLKHQLPEKDVSQHFGTSDQKSIGKMITKMGQRELQAKFREVFETPTYSNNNNWLRRKLMEAAGLPAPRVQQKVRRAGKPAKSHKKAKKAPSPGGGGAGVTKRKPHPSIKAPKLDCHTSEKRRSLRQMAKAQDGTLVWAKMKGHGYWPAQVMDPCNVLALDQPTHPDSSVLVRFVEVESHAWVSQADVLDLAKHWDLLSFSNSAPKFQTALSTARRLMLSSNGKKDMKATSVVSNTSELQKSIQDMPIAANEMPAVETFSHESTDDILATNHLSHFCESLLISSGAGDSHHHITPFMDDNDNQDLLIQESPHGNMHFFTPGIGGVGILL